MRRGGLPLAFAALAASPVAARAPAPPTGTLTLALPDPVVTVTVAGVPLRLSVALDGRGVVALNRAAVDRLPIAFAPAASAEVGRIELPGRAAPAVLSVAGRQVPAALWSFGDCCAGVDGAIDATLLPYAEVRFVRAGAAGGSERTLLLVPDEDYGLAAREPAGGRTLHVQFALDRAETLSTAAAGAILARTWGGRFDGGYAPAAVAWGVARPSRMLVFARSGDIAGFRFDRLRTRTADFAGRERLPTDPASPGDIVVRRRRAPQHGWPAVMIGRDRLGRCGEIRLQTQLKLLTLRCDFAG